LGALIPSAESAQPAALSQEALPGRGAAASLLNIPVNDILPNPHQTRAALSPDSLEELTASIREHGVLQPLIVTRARPTDPAPYQLIAGERRWRAAQLAGLKTVPALVKEATSQQILELALVENVQRADLNPLEEAAAYQALIAEFGLTQGEVAGRVGKSRAAVANVVRLLRLPEPVKALLAEGTLSEGHARALLALPDDATLLRAARQVVARDLTVRQTEDLVRRLLAIAEAVAPEPEPEPADTPYALETRRLEDAFRNSLGTKVSLRRGRRGGRLVIHFYSDEELQAIYEQIVGVDN
jgi:ParB family chromosome partitioning protein